MMMKTTLVSSALLLLCAVTAQAKEYGDPGTISISGSVDINSNTEDLDDGGKTESTTLGVRPGIGFYLMEHLELIGGLELESTSTKDDAGDKSTTTGFGANVGAGYFFEAGKMHLGPVVLLGFGSETEKDDADDSEITTSGPGASVQLQLKTVVGGGGLVTMGLGYDYDQLDVEFKTGGATLKDKGTRSGPRIFLGIGVFF